MDDLKKNTLIKLIGGGSVKTIDDGPFNGGGQGDVYHVSYENRKCVLKWYNHESILSDESFYTNLQNLVDEEPIEGFVWPLRVSLKSEKKFGYVMEEIPDKMISLVDVLRDKTDISQMTLKKICYNLANIFGELHNKGYCFKDLNDDNIFIDSENGNVLICDCDNISKSIVNYSVMGKMGYIAPEVCVGNAPPNILSDRFSLAVVIYALIVRDYPLRGKRTVGFQNEQDDLMVHGKNPIFTMDPYDDSNRPIRKETENIFNGLPEDLKNAFLTSFTKGLNDPESRLSESDWKIILNPNKGVKSVLMGRRGSTPKRLQTVLFIIDSSNSMKGPKMEEVNSALDAAIPELNDVGGAITTVETNILQFSDEANWIFDKPVSCAELIKIDSLEITGKWTRFDKACMLLDEFLIDENLDDNTRTVNSPLIILLTDGNPINYKDNLEQLWKNKWFQRSHKVSIGIDSESEKSDRNMLVEFTRDEQLVMTTNEIRGKLGQLIKDVTISVTRVVSNSGNHNDLVNIINQLRKI